MQTKAGIKGELAEEYLYEFVNANRGLSIYDLSERLGWNVEELHNLVKMLEEGGLIRINESEEEEKRKRKVYPVGWKDLLPEDVKKSNHIHQIQRLRYYLEPLVLFSRFKYFLPKLIILPKAGTIEEKFTFFRFPLNIVADSSWFIHKGKFTRFLTYILIRSQSGSGNRY